jgi:hypothetical protein
MLLLTSAITLETTYEALIRKTKQTVNKQAEVLWRLDVLIFIDYILVR